MMCHGVTTQKLRRRFVRMGFNVEIEMKAMKPYEREQLVCV